MKRPIRSWVGLNHVILAHQWLFCLVFGRKSGIVCMTAQVVQGAVAPQFQPRRTGPDEDSDRDSINDGARFNIRPKKG